MWSLAEWGAECVGRFFPATCLLTHSFHFPFLPLQLPGTSSTTLNLVDRRALKGTNRVVSVGNTVFFNSPSTLSGSGCLRALSVLPHTHTLVGPVTRLRPCTKVLRVLLVHIYCTCTSWVLLKHMFQILGGNVTEPSLLYEWQPNAS